MEGDDGEKDTFDACNGNITPGVCEATEPIHFARTLFLPASGH